VERFLLSRAPLWPVLAVAVVVTKEILRVALAALAAEEMAVSFQQPLRAEL
jgi:hypothetical protein